MIRFVVYALPMLLLLLASFGFVVDFLDLEPRAGSVIRLAFFEQPRVPAPVVLGAWTMEACGLLALFLLAQGRCGAWWLDGLVAGWLAWVFRGPLLVVTIVVAVRQPQDPWWTLAFGWWILYSLCGLSLGLLAHRSGMRGAEDPPGDGAPDEADQGEAEQGEADQDEAVSDPAPASGARAVPVEADHGEDPPDEEAEGAEVETVDAPSEVAEALESEPSEGADPAGTEVLGTPDREPRY